MNFSYAMDNSTAYIITLNDHPLGHRCLDSCRKVGQQAELYPAVDGTQDVLTYPASLPRWFKVTDHHLSQTEVACALSHISLWAKCVEQDHPLIVLEHDAIMVQALPEHPVFGCIVYLGSQEQKNGWKVFPTPPHATNGPNYHFICRAHAYSVDPAIAKNMLAHVLKYGIHESLDIMLRADIFPIVQTGFYAYDEPGETTITNRKQTPAGRER